MELPSVRRDIRQASSSPEAPAENRTRSASVISGSRASQIISPRKRGDMRKVTAAVGAFVASSFRSASEKASLSASASDSRISIVSPSSGRNPPADRRADRRSASQGRDAFVLFSDGSAGIHDAISTNLTAISPFPDRGQESSGHPLPRSPRSAVSAGSDQWYPDG